MQHELKGHISDADIQRFGRHFAWGVAQVIGLMLIGALALAVVINAFDLGTDDSDRNGWKRSGFDVRTDYKTGLQYLVSPKGSITPRLDGEGRHMRAGE
jgi:hypothetical protein